MWELQATVLSTILACPRAVIDSGFRFASFVDIRMGALLAELKEGTAGFGPEYHFC